MSDLRVVASEVRDEFTEVLDELLNLDHTLPLGVRINRAKRLFDRFDDSEIPDETRLVDWATLIGEEDSDAFDWLIPILLERQ